MNKITYLLFFILFVNFFLFRQFGLLALALVILALWLLVVKVFDSASSKTRHIKWWGSALLLLTTSLIAFVSSPEKIALLLLLALEIMAISVYSWLKNEKVSGILELGLSSLIVAKGYLSAGIKIFSSFFDGNLKKILNINSSSPKQQSPWLRSILTGGLIGLPLVAWLVSLLAKADPIFANFISQLLSDEVLKELPTRLLISFAMLLFLIPLLIIKLNRYVSPLGWLTKVNWGRELTVITAMVVMIMGVFLVVQWPYVFANVALETDLSKFGVATYSEYVKRGFADLIKVVIFVFATAWIGMLVNKNKVGQEHKILSIVQALLGLEFVIFVISILRRVWLYQAHHGLSLARLYGLALLVMISGLAVTMALRYFYKKVTWAKVEAIWIVLVIVASLGLNMEKLVISNPPTVNNRVDYVYLSRLSADGYQGWLKAYLWTNEFLGKQSQNSGLIDREARRDLYYSEIIIKQLSQNFHELIKDYGTDEEIKAYFLAKIQMEKKRVEEHYDFGDYQGVEQERERRLKEIAQLLEAMDKDDYRERVGITLVGSRSNVGFGSTFLRDEGVPKEYFGSRNKSDMLLNWNYSRYSTYQKLKTEIGFANIFRLQEEFLDLDARVASQPSEEQSYDIDISLESPFLQ
jgi:hypothetical protein